MFGGVFPDEGALKPSSAPLFRSTTSREKPQVPIHGLSCPTSRGCVFLTEAIVGIAQDTSNLKHNPVIARGGALDIFQSLVRATERIRAERQDAELFKQVNAAVNVAKSAGARIELLPSFVQRDELMSHLESPILEMEDRRGAHRWTAGHYALANGKASVVRMMKDFNHRAATVAEDVFLDTELEERRRRDLVDEQAKKLHPMGVVFPTMDLHLSAMIFRRLESLKREIFAELPPVPPPPRQWHRGYYGRGRDGLYGSITWHWKSAEWTFDSIIALSDSRTLSSLAWMTRYGFNEMMLPLFPLLPSVDCPLSSSGITLLMVAAMYNQCSTAEQLIDLGANVNAVARLRESDGRSGGLTAILVASEVGCLEMVRCLLKHDADPNAQDECGNTAVHHAVQRKNFAMVKLLLHHGASIDVLNNGGDSPEDVAAALRYLSIQRLLRWWGTTLHLKLTDDVATRAPCRVERDYAAWVEATKVFYKRLDQLHQDGSQLINKIEEDSVPALMYERFTHQHGVDPSRSVLNALIPHWWPEDIRRLHLYGVFLGEKGVRVLFHFTKLLTHLEELSLPDCMLSNQCMPDLCHAAMHHPHLRRILLPGNRLLSRPTGLLLLALAKNNTNIVGIDLRATSVDEALRAAVQREVERNMKRQASACSDPSVPAERSESHHKVWHLPRENTYDKYVETMRSQERDGRSRSSSRRSRSRDSSM
jgi:hypothetical protein